METKMTCFLLGCETSLLAVSKENMKHCN
jgi:hypothetical protein